MGNALFALGILLTLLSICGLAYVLDELLDPTKF
jgi:hypothetical protein